MMVRMTDQTNGPTGPDQNRTSDPLRTIGIVVVGLAAAVLSFQTWVQIAQTIGFTAHWSMGLPGGRTISFWIAWLYPVTIDCFAMLVTREWIRSKPGSAQRSWARANSIGAIALSYGGQAAYHAFEGRLPPVGYVVFMGGMPPLIVGLVVHLYTKSNAEKVGPDQTIEAQTILTTLAQTIADHQTTGPDQTTTPDVDQPTRPAAPASRPDQAGPPKPTRPTRDRTTPTNRGGLHVVGGVVDSMADQIDHAYPDQIPSRSKVMERFGWSSAGQAGTAIRMVRERREAGPVATDQTSAADDQEQDRVASA